MKTNVVDLHSVRTTVVILTTFHQKKNFLVERKYEKSEQDKVTYVTLIPSISQNFNFSIFQGFNRSKMVKTF